MKTLTEDLGVEVCVKCDGELVEFNDNGPDDLYERDDGDWLELGAVTKICAVCGHKARSRIYFPKAGIAEIERLVRASQGENDE